MPKTVLNSEELSAKVPGTKIADQVQISGAQTVVFVEKHDLYRCETASIHERQDVRMLRQGYILLQY